MENFEKENQIIQYLDKKYVIKEKLFITKYDNEHHWGYEIADDLPRIFSFENEFCKTVLTQWAYDNDFDKRDFDKAWGTKKLKTSWSPETAQDLQVQYGITTAEETLTRMLADELRKELDAQILSDLREQLIQPNDFLGVVKCLGYEPSGITYELNTFVPRKYFVPIKYHDMMNEREKNPLWQEWLRRQT